MHSHPNEGGPPGAMAAKPVMGSPTPFRTLLGAHAIGFFRCSLNVCGCAG